MFAMKLGAGRFLGIPIESSRFDHVTTPFSHPAKMLAIIDHRDLKRNWVWVSHGSWNFNF